MGETYEFHGRVVAESPSALLVDCGEIEVWIPRSQIVASADELEVGIETTIEVPAWFAEKAGIV
jgi:hypothetical protein